MSDPNMKVKGTSSQYITDDYNVFVTLKGNREKLTLRS